ncbi:hypothetical protein HDU67_005824, partial [Dinochytrium kinnereticum]
MAANDGGGSQHELNEADLLQLDASFTASHATPQAVVAPGDSSQSLLDLELTEPEPKSHADTSQGKASPEKASAGLGMGGSPNRKIASFGTKMADAFKKGMRSRSPSVGSHPMDAAIPFSTPPSSNAELDFFASVADSQPRGRLPAKSAATSPDRHSTDSRSGVPRPSLEQRLHHRSITMPSDLPIGTSISPTAAILDFSAQSQALAQPQQTFVDELPQLIPVPVLAPVEIDPKYSSLPTRRWTDFSAFHQIPNIDPVNDIMNKAFANDDVIFKPQRSLLSLEDSEREHGPEKMLDALIRHRSWKA